MKTKLRIETVFSQLFLAIAPAFFVLLAALFAPSAPAHAADESSFIVKTPVGTSEDQARAIFDEQGFEVTSAHPEAGFYFVRKVTKSANEKALAGADGIQYVERGATRYAYEVTPNDAKYRDQDGLKALQAQHAWNTQKGSGKIVVAVIDTGVAIEHEDLKNRIWQNAKEIAGNGVDDDNNGYVDDTTGWDFANKDNNPTDDNDHGSHVAGIIGAEANNGIGIAGVNWDVTIMPLKFLKGSGSGSDEDAIQAILYAANNGAHIINASWGSGEYTQALADAIQYAGTKGVLFAAAAGNDNANIDSTGSYPAGYDLPSIVSVGASDSSHGKASFSSYGRTRTHLSAPGVDILSALKGSRSYGRLSGTSMATPMVAGVAALVLAEEPSLNVAGLRNALLNAVDVKKAWEGLNATDGVLNAATAVAQLQTAAQVWPQRLALRPGRQHAFTAYGFSGALTWSTSDAALATIDSNGLLTAVAAGTVNVQVRDAKGKTVSTQAVQVVAEDKGGGCGKSKASAANTQNASAGVTVILLLLPLIVAVLLQRQREAAAKVRVKANRENPPRA